jgi:protein-disulfide isomerase
MSKRQELRQKRAQQERMQRLTLIIGVLVIALAIVGWVILAQNQPAVTGVVKPPVIVRSQVKDNTAGDPNAPVKIIEYADFQCPYCMYYWRDTEAKIISTYVNTGKVYLEFHSVGSFIGTGTQSPHSALSAYCAGDQNKFWEMHDAIYANQGVENSNALDDAHLVAIAGVVPGLDMNQWNSCFTSGKYAARVEQDAQDAQKNIPAATNFAALVAANQYSSGGISTPSFLVNNQLVPGALQFADFQKVIEAALATAGKK